jgi:hypothetical protein
MNYYQEKHGPNLRQHDVHGSTQTKMILLVALDLVLTGWWDFYQAQGVY